jgi:hypothetical protein
MHKKRSEILIYFLAITFLALISCNQNEDVLVYNPELVFPNSFKISVEPYSYSNSDSSETYWMLGDSAVFADTVNGQPTFQWIPSGTNIVTVVISKEQFNVSAGNIENADSIIWQWQPGMETGKMGKVAYIEGKPVKNKKIEYDKQPLPLENGLYFWAVYGWDSGGREVIFSTKPQEMYVK